MVRIVSSLQTPARWYQRNRVTYETLARKVEDIIKENLSQKHVQYHSITSRCKSLESYVEKAKNKNYSDPISQITDMAGVRIITYLESDVRQVADIIEELFDIDSENSLDKSQLLGSNILGYRSVHYIAKLSKNRISLPENMAFKNLTFEIQIRSILQHAWAEIEHDRNYKFSGKLPTKIERRFYLVAGMLEMADREFVSISQDIESYRLMVSDELSKGELDIEINTASLREYLATYFKTIIEKGFLSDNFSQSENATMVVQELSKFGISRIHQFENIIPKSLSQNILKLKYKDTFIGIIRDILIIKDARKYFTTCWNRKWAYTDPTALELWENYPLNIPNFRNYLKALDIKIEPEPDV